MNYLFKQWSPSAVARAALSHRDYIFTFLTQVEHDFCIAKFSEDSNCATKSTEAWEWVKFLKFVNISFFHGRIYSNSSFLNVQSNIIGINERLHLSIKSISAVNLNSFIELWLQTGDFSIVLGKKLFLKWKF